MLRLGKGLLGPVMVNLAHIPHLLLGSAANSGKSTLLKLALMEAYYKGAELFDRAGRSKEAKEVLAQIDSKLATLARLGCGFGPFSSKA